MKQKLMILLNPKKSWGIFSIIFAIFLIAPFCLRAALTWPADTTGQEVGGLLPGTYEPSGLSWQSRLQKILLVGDGGQITEMNSDGSELTTWTPNGNDNEAITVANPESNYVYIGVENPDSIVEFDLSLGALTGKSWDLTPWMASVAPNQGLEALTFVPNGHHPYVDSASGGVFYAGMQEDGKIYVFDVSLSASGSVSFLGNITPKEGTTDLADMYFDDNAEVLYALFDTNNLLIEMQANGTIVNEYEVPGIDQEGVMVLSSYPDRTVPIFIAQDSNHSVLKYDNYPVLYPTSKDTVLPEISFSLDKTKYTSAEQVNITASASDDYELEKIVISIDGIEKTVCFSSSCNYIAGPYHKKSNTNLTISAQAVDKAENSKSISQTIKIYPAIAIKTKKSKAISGQEIKFKTKVSASRNLVKNQKIYINGRRVKTCRTADPCIYTLKKYNLERQIFYKVVLNLNDGESVSTSYVPVKIIKNSKNPVIYIVTDKREYKKTQKPKFTAASTEKLKRIYIVANNKIVKTCKNEKTCIYQKRSFKKYAGRDIIVYATGVNKEGLVNMTNKFKVAIKK